MRASAATAAATIPVAVGTGALLGKSELSDELLLVCGISLFLLLPLVVRRDRVAGIEPVVWLGIALAAMFVARPIAIWATGDYVLRGRIDIRDSLREGLLVALTGVAAFAVGYGLVVGRVCASRIPRLPALPPPSTITLYAAILLAAGLGAYAVGAVLAGGTPLALVSGQLTQGGGTDVAYLYLAPFVAIPAALLFMSAGFQANDRRLIILAVALCALMVLLLAPAGQRLWLLLSVSSIGLYPYLSGRWHPSRTLVLIVAVVAFVGLTMLRDLHPGDGAAELGATAVENLADPTAAVKVVFTGPDTEMLDGLAAETAIIPSIYPHRPGGSITTLLAQPIPRIFWPDKPRPLDDDLSDQLFRTNLRGGAQNAQVATSIMSNFYLDSGLIGVAVGMLMVGVASRALWEYFRLHSRDDSVILLYAVSLPLLTVAMRGSLAITLGRALFVVGPLLFAALVLQPRGTRLKAPDVVER